MGVEIRARQAERAHEVLEEKGSLLHRMVMAQELPRKRLLT